MDPTEASKRFVRSVYDVDRSVPSPLRWQRWPSRERSYVRRMGLVESFFHTMGSLHHGRTDIFYRLHLSVPKDAKDHIVERLPLAFAVLCRRHPLLASHVLDLTPDLQPFDEALARSLRQTGSSDGSASALSEPHFAADRVLFLPEDWELGLDPVASATSSGHLPQDAAARWLRKYVRNGPRRFLRQDVPYGLCRLLVLPSAGTEARQSFDLIVCAAHCISDGLSISALVAELLQLLVSEDLPQAILHAHDEPADAVLPGARRKRFADLSDGTKSLLQAGASARNGTSRRDDAILAEDVEPLLPPAIEAAYPSLLPPHPTGRHSLARKRWFWILRRVRAQVQSARSLSNYLTDFVAQVDRSAQASTASLPESQQDWGARTNWSAVQLDEQNTKALVVLSKGKGVRIGAVLYAVSACALNQMEREHEEKNGLQGINTNALGKTGLTKSTVIGFPFSIRQYLQAESTTFERDEQARTVPDTAIERPPARSPSALSVQLGFGGISFPPSDIFSLFSRAASPVPSSVSDSLNLDERETFLLWKMARHAQNQLDALFHDREAMMADGFVTALERENRFRMQGVRDVFETREKLAHEGASRGDEQIASNDGGDDERRPGLLKKNMQGPGSSLNFSMLGQLDRTVPASLSLPTYMCSGARGESSTLEVSEQMLIGVRCRKDEAFGTSFTFRGRLTLEMGHDTTMWDTVEVERYLVLMRRILVALANSR